jgi:thioredoxin reductase (NADPH)
VTQSSDPGASELNRELAADLPDPAAPTLDAEALAELAPFGEERVVEAGDILFRAGDESYDFLVILEGAVDIVRPDREGDTLITTHVPGRFLGELNMLTGQRLYLTRPG